ncbi:sulfur transferase domain-containing protein [Isosphaeraceae bacterium EP7]
MNFQRTVAPNVVIADQPTESDLLALKEAGYVGIVNLRNDGEPEQPIDPKAEASRAADLGLDYLHYGVGSAPFTREGVASVVDFIDGHAANGKVLVHCRKGGRAAALVLLQQIKANGWTPDEAFERGKASGLEVEGGLKKLVEGYLAENPDIA